MITTNPVLRTRQSPRMFPVGDDNTQRRTTPYVTFALVGLNILVFLIELSGGDQFIQDWAFVPARFSANPEANAITIFSASATGISPTTTTAM